MANSTERMVKKLKLPDVTLFCVDRNDPIGAKRAVDICTKDIDFGEVILITSHQLFEGRRGYSDWIIQGLNEYINTSHVVIVHADGYIANPQAWDDKWLDLDYIGSPWLWHKEHCVGNGVSLRSKKLLKILASLDLEGIDTFPEDAWICRSIRDWLEREYDIKFASIEEAKKFGIEGYGLMPSLNIYEGQFLFHGFGVRGLPYPPILPNHKSNGHLNNNRKLIRR